MKRISISAAVLLSAVVLSAQNLNPKVQVVNDYDVSVSDADKGGLELSVPDTLLRFDYKFDYDFFKSDYKGAYDVSRYFIRTTPSPAPKEKRNLFLSAGIGYYPAPELQLGWQALDKGFYTLGVDNDFGGFCGGFNSAAGSAYTGYDLSEHLNVINVLRFKTSVLKVNAGYDGLFNSGLKGAVQNTYSNYSSGFAQARITASKRPGPYFHYDFGLKYRYSNDFCSYLGENNENLLEIDGSVAPAIRKDKYRVFIDLAYTLDSNRGYVETFNQMVMVKPHVGLVLGKFNLDLGVKMSFATRFNVFPDVTASVKVADDYLNIFVGCQGGETMNTFSSLKFADHIYNAGFGQLGTTSLERINAFAGLSGFAGTSFNYMVKGGFSNHYGAAVRAIDTVGYDFGIALIDYNLAYAKLMLGWNDERIDSDLTLDYARTWVDERNTNLKPGRVVFLTPDFRLNARFTYNWNRRIYAGATLEWQSEARTYGAADFRNTPSFVDLGIVGKYRFDDRWSVWLKGANLLNQEIWYSDFYARKGVACTVGFTLTL